MEKTVNALIVSFTPYFLERGNFWFKKNLSRILQARQIHSFWQNNTIFLEKGQLVKLSNLLRKFDEMGYEKVFKVREPGEFSQNGGVVEIFPINLSTALRLDFLGNQLENIEKLNIKTLDEETQKDLLKRKLKSEKIFSDLHNLKPGDYLVHLDHGVGKFEGKEKLPNRYSLAQDYYVLKYAGGDKLYVPIGLERKLSRYVGFQEPKVSRLGSTLWQRTKRKVKEDIEKLAKELLTLYSKKEIATREVYKEADELEKEIIERFSYQLTPDQASALKDIEKDFRKIQPLDRIICGDVGFGKTEIALRAAIRAVNNGYQVALLAPTTILASQHFQTFTERLKGFPIKTALLSRIQTKRETQEIQKGIKEGKIDILIGTHKILSPLLQFSNLQLLIIDDEQKFGVKQKEYFRKIKPSLDILSLSATPIPRTLYLSLSSLKNISFIQTPPPGRKNIKTYILPQTKKIIKKAIEFELQRKGQIYFLHNKISNISQVKNDLEKLGTQARITILHAKLQENKILKIMEDFQKRKIDLLLTTTIIENGLDLPNVNTLVVDDARNLGLAQTYQIRGRVGRSNTQSFAYFLYPKRAKLNDLTKKRFKALKEAEEIGSGYKIALRDLEIRGAGNILGKEQSGNINKIGLNLYCQMLASAVERVKVQRNDQKIKGK